MGIAEGLNATAVEAKKRGVLKTGFQVKHAPADGGKVVIFDTLDDLEVDPALNDLRHLDWNLARESDTLGRSGRGRTKSGTGTRSRTG